MTKTTERELEPKQTVQPKEKVYTMATPQEAQQFAWKQETGYIQSYQHMDMGRYIHIDGRDGQFYDRDRNPISEKQGLDFRNPGRPGAFAFRRQG